MFFAALIGPGAALNDATQSFGGDIPGDVRHHFDQDEAPVAAVLRVHLQHRVAGGAAARKGVQYEVAGVGGDLQDALDEARGFGRGKHLCSIRYELDNFLFGLLSVADLLVQPNGLRDNALLNIRKKALSDAEHYSRLSPTKSVHLCLVHRISLSIPASRCLLAVLQQYVQKGK